MKKQILKSALMAMAGVGLLAGGAMADAFNTNRPFTAFGDNSEPSLQETFNTLTVDSSVKIDAVKDQSSAALWQITDGSSESYKIAGYAGYTSTIGIYSASSVDEVLLRLDPVTYQAFFDILGGTTLKVIDWDPTVNDGLGGLVTNFYTGFGSSFGFFLDVTNTDARWYTEDSKNTDGGFGPDKNIMALSYQLADGTLLKWSTAISGLNDTFEADGDDWLLAFEDIGTAGTGEPDFNDRLFLVEDLTPVPEPATMLLFGTGLAGLAAVARRRKTQA